VKNFAMAAFIAAFLLPMGHSIAQEEERAVPILQAPFHLPVFRNEYITLLNVNVPPGKTTGYHIHTGDSVSVNIGAADMTNQDFGSSVVSPPGRGEPGRVSMQIAAKRPRHIKR
jgi:hypothetical protein